MTRTRVGCLGIALIVLLCISLLVNLIMVAAAGARKSMERPKFQETLVEKGSGTQKIAVISLRGLISSSMEGALGESMVEDVKFALRQAVDDEDVKAIVLHVDSPGGEVTASDDIYNAVRQTREKKPIVVYMGSLAASGGYYVACGANHLIANETTITGSIGVIVQSLKYYDLFNKIGLQTVTFKSGQFKDILSGTRDMTPEEIAYIQALVMQTYDRFVGIVAQGRSLPVEELKRGIADGRILTGRDALAAKLIDELGYIEQAFAKAKELGGAPEAAIVRYQPPFHLGRLLKFLGKTDASLQLNVGPQVLSLEPGRLYLLPSLFVP